MERVIESKIVFQCPVFQVEEAEVELLSGERQKRWYVVKSDAVGIVAVNDAGEILLTREYRSASAKVHWRIPAGGVEEGETPEEAAHRELREETGYDSRNLTLLLSTKRPSALVKQTTHSFLATDLFPSPLAPLEFEQIEVVPTPPHRVMEIIAAGEIEGGIATALRMVCSQRL